MNRNRFRAAGLLASLLLAATAVTAQSRAVVSANAKGNRDLDTGRYEDALKNYTKALNRAEDEGDAQYQAMAMYGIARANARLCRTDIAEKWFRDSIALRETLPDQPEGAWLTQNYIEFARFLLSRGRTEEAARYFGQAIPKLEDMGIEQMDPIGYANLLDDYVAAMKSVGLVQESESFAARASDIRLKYPDRKADFRPLPYPINCD